MHRHGPPERARSSAGWLLALASWIAFAGTSVQVYRARSDPEGFAPRALAGWLVSGADLAGVAQDHLATGLAILNDSSRPTTERIRGYRAELTLAESLLARSVRSCPTQALALAQLAAVRWELAPPLEPEALARHLSLIGVAASVAPFSARVRLELGALLLQMGLTEPALLRLREAVTLEPASSRDAVALLERNLFAPQEILARLPPVPPVLIAVYEIYPDASSDPTLLQTIESALDPGSAVDYPALMRCYTRTALRQDQPERLRSVLDRLGPLRQPAAEAVRLQQRSRARLALGRDDAALDDARAARIIAPDSVALAEYLGDLLLLRGDASAAFEEFRQALRLLARGSGDRGDRARIYRKSGQAEESRGAPDRAYDAYRRALQLDPDEPHAAARVQEMRSAAGISR